MSTASSLRTSVGIRSPLPVDPLALIPPTLKQGVCVRGTAAMSPPSGYILLSPAELARVRLEAAVWEPEAEALLDQIGVGRGWRCADLGCGAIGVLAPLARRTGPEEDGGRVVGVETDPLLLAAARELTVAEGLPRAELHGADPFATGLPARSFDLVHERFLLAQFGAGGRERRLLAEMLRLVRPGGVVALQEPDSSAWSCWPPLAEFDDLRALITDACRAGGGDFDAGRRTHAMLREAGLSDVRLRSAVLGLPPGHPYRRFPLMLAACARRKILGAGLATERALDRLIAACEAAAADRSVVLQTFIVTQVWGRKPGV